MDKRPCVISVILTALWAFAALQANSTFDAKAEEQGNEPDAKAVLNEAHQIVRRQDKYPALERDFMLLDIAALQTRAQDFGAALHVIKSCRESYARDDALHSLAVTVARAGQKKMAFDVLGEIEVDDDGCGGYGDSVLRMNWLEHLIADGNLEGARQAVDEMTSPWSRREGLSKLATANYESGNNAEGRRLFQLAFTAATSLSDEFDHVPGISKSSDEYVRAIAIWKVAQTQSEVAEMDDVSSTIQQLVQHAETSKDGLSRVGLLREAAVLSAAIGNHTTAKQLFRQAIDARESIKPPTPCPESNRIGALKTIIGAQAAAGYIDEALKATRLLTTPDGGRAEALCSIVVAQATAGDMAGAVATAHSIQDSVQYTTNALVEIANLQVKSGKLNDSLATVDQIEDRFAKATAFLEVATAYAKAGDKKTARDVAARVRVTSWPYSTSIDSAKFDFSRPQTWGIVYGDTLSGTNAMRRGALESGADFSAAAMTLSQALEQQHPDSYATMFEDVSYEQIVRALARAHATSGDSNEALAWAQQIGSAEKIESEEDWEVTTSVKQRIYALIGVAEGLLDKQSGVTAP